MTISKPCFIFNKIVIYKLLPICILAFYLALQTSAQTTLEKGLPFVTNYRYQDYGADGINWWATEDDNGVLYFANNNGLLIYDGSQWELIKIPGGVRCVEKGADGKIYLGTMGDIGYMNPGKNGKLEFVSLKEKLRAKYQTFQEVWAINKTSSSFYFKTNNYIFIWDYKTMQVLESKEGFHITAVVNDQLYARIWNRGLTVLKNDSFYVVPNGEKFANERIYAMLPYDNDRILIGTRTKGLFLYDGKDFTPFKTEADPYIFNTSLYGGLVLSNGLFALNTFNNGMAIIDKHGKLIRRIDKSMGLQDNSVDYLFEDSRGILWMSLFNGIAKLDLYSSLTFFDESMGLPAKTVFSVVSLFDTVYAGTNNGIYFLDKSTNRFKYVTGTSGQVYGIQKFKNYVVAGGAEKGFLKISGGKASPLIAGNNYDFHVTSFLQSNFDSTLFYFSLRNGIAAVRYQPKTGQFTAESSRSDIRGRQDDFLQTEDGDLWVDGSKAGEIILVKPDKGGGKINLAEAPFETYDYKKGFPVGGVGIGSYDGTTYFIASADSIFTFDKKQDRFVRDTTSLEFLKKYISDVGDASPISPKDNKGRIWANFGTGVFVKIPAKDGSFKIVDAPFRELRKDYPIWNISPTVDKQGNSIVWFAGRDGIVRYDGNLQEATSGSFKTIIREIKLNEDSVFYSGFMAPANKPNFSHSFNSVRFRYAAPFFKQEGETLFSTLLEGRDKNWSEWTKQNFREFGNLDAGKYTFKVKAKNIYDTESSESTFSFEVLPPWYATWWAWLLYAALALATIYFLVKWRTRQLHEKHRELEKIVHERTAQLSERVEELAVINSVQESLVAQMDINSIYELVGEKIRNIFHAQVIDIVTYDAQNNLIEDKYAYEKGDRTMLGKRVPKGIRKHIIETGEILLHNENVEQASLELGNEVLIGEMPKSQVYVPMVAGGDVKGIISLQNLDREHAFSDSDVVLITTLANSMSVALESARLFDETTRLLKETEQRNAELAVINSVQESLVAKMDIKGIYDLVGEKIRDIFHAQVIDIVTYDAKHNLIEDQYAYEKGDRTLLGSRVPRGMRKHIIETGEVLLINKDLERLRPIYDNTVIVGEAAKSLVFVPMVTGGNVKGIISLQNLDRENAFSDSDVNLITTLANSMSVALESARLFDETTRLLKETEQRNAELAVINSVQESLVAKMDIKGIYELVGEKIREIFDAQVIDIVTYDHDKNLIEDQYSFEKGDRTLIGPREPKGFRKHVIKTSQLLLHNSNVEQAMHDFDNVVLIGEIPKSQVFVPMIATGKVKGIISLQNLDHEQAFSNSDISLLTTLANSMSVALESARLFDETTRLLKETEQRTAELAVINSVQEGLAKELDIQGIYDLVGDRVRQLFDAQVVGIATFNYLNETEKFQYMFEKGVRFYPKPRPYDKLRRHLIQTRQKILINNDFIEAYNKFGMKAVTGSELPKSALYVPLSIGDKITSYVTLQNIDKENAFSESDVRLLETLANSMSVALENARLFDETARLLKETEQRTAELSVINSVQDGLAKELDIQGIYNLVGEKIREIFNAQVIDIVTYDSKTNLIEDRYSYEKGDRTLLGPREAKGFRKNIIETGQLVVINHDFEKVSQQYENIILIGEQPKSAVVVPMSSGGKINGMISIQNLDHEYAFSNSDVNLLTTLANSMSVALESARLFDETNRLLKETEQRTAELSVINSVQEGLAKELDIQGIYNLVGEKIREIFNAQVIDIVTYDPKLNLIEDRYSFEKGDRTLLGSREPKGFRQSIIETGQSLLINHDYDAMSIQYGNTTVIGQQPKSAVVVPMMSGGKVNGMVSLQNLDHEYAFSDADVNLLNTLSNSMSVALESARLFDETNRLLKETEQRTAELSVINSVQHGLAKELDIQGIYEMVGEKMRDIFNAQVIDIVTYDPKLNVIEDRYAYEKGDTTLLGPREPQGLRKHIIDTGNLLVINHDYENVSRQYNSEILYGEQPKSVVVAPMISGGKVNGMISLQNLDHEYAFSDSDISLLTTLSNSMSVALESARLFDETNRLLKETEQRTAELSVINSVQEGLAKELDIQGIYELIGEKMREIFNAQVFDIVTYDKTTGLIEDRYTYEMGDRTLLPPRPLIGFRKHVIESGQSLVINENIEEHMRKLGNVVIIGEASKSVVFVPMFASGEVTGVISLQNIDQEHAFSASDVRLLTTLGNSMSVALESARLFDETNRLLKETEKRTEELSVINSVQEGLAKEPDINGIYELVGEKVREVFNAQVIDIVTYDKKTGLIEDRYTYEKGDRTLLAKRPLKGFRKHVIETAKTLLINKDVDTLRSTYDNTVIVGEAAKSLVFVPMITGVEVTGVISLQNIDRENAFSDADVNLLTTFSNSMTVALENARLFEETTHLLSQAKQRAAELSTVNSISKALASQLDADDLIKLVGDQLKNLFNANIVYLALLNQKTKIIYFPYQFGDDMAPMKLGEGLTSKIILTGDPLLINEDLAEQHKQMGIQRVGISSASYLGVPIPVGEEIIGVLSVQSTEQENRFNENDLRLLSTIASSVGVALRNATLFEDVKLAKMEAEAASKLAEKANEAKSAFLSTVSHELRTPLTSVLGFAKIIEKRLAEKIFPIVDKSDVKTGKTINQITDNLHIVISEGERLTHLINDVLDLAKIEAGKMEWNQESVSMSEVAERAIAATTSLFEQKSLKLIKQIDDNLPEITGDKDKLIQVIINLISNSVKFTDKGFITCKISKKKSEVIVSIADTGIGIAAEDFGAVFEQFKQVGGDTLTDKPKGTGLGLPICKEIVEHHGGRIWLESEPGKGSTFYFALPFIKPTASSRPIHLDDLVKQLKERVAYSKTNIQGRASNILIVDDDDSIRSLLHQELGDAGYTIQEARNGKEALWCVRSQRPDLIILDVMMPEMNGFDTAAVLKNDPETMDIPIIVLSVVQDKARGFRIGVDRYLTKPIDTSLLFTEIGSLLEQGKSKKKVMIVDEDSGAVNTLTDVLTTKGYEVMEANENELLEKAVANLPDIIIISSSLSGKQDIVKTLRFEKGLENVLFVVYQ